jgi:hypothetical protein
MAESLRTPPFLLEHYHLRTKAVRFGNCIGASIRWTRIARVAKACAHPRWPPGQYEVLTNDEPRHQPARQETRPNQRLCVSLGSPPSVAVGSHRRVPPTEAARLKYISRMNSIAAPVKIFKGVDATRWFAAPKRPYYPATCDASRQRRSLIYNHWKSAHVHEPVRKRLPCR